MQKQVQSGSQQRSVLITGCSSGIGLEAARTLKGRGWRVLATARRPEDLARLRDDEGLEALHLELTDAKSITECAKEAFKLTDGKLDALFNNAAYGQMGAIEDVSVDTMRHQFEVNVIGTHDLTCQIIPSMRARGQGRVVQCSSVLGLVSGPYRGAYCATKFALEGLSDALRMELKGSGIHVSLIEPGPIKTRFLENALASFKANIDIENSVHRETYKNKLEAMEDGGKKLFKQGPEAVVTKLVHALESPRPKLRYFVTKPTYIADVLRRVLPGRMLDVVSSRQ